MAEEKGYEKRLRDACKKRGGIAVKIWCLSLAGLPDRMILMPAGKIYFAELKSIGKWPSPIQKRRIAQLRKLGFRVFVINSNETLERCLLEI